MYLRTLKLRNFRCFEEITIDFHDRLSVIVGSNGAGKTSVLEGAAVSMGTLFTAMDGLSGLSISKRDARLKAYLLGNSSDVQPQYPVEIAAVGVENGTSVEWKRSLKGEGGSTTIKDARDMTDIAKGYQERLRAGDPALILPVIAYYGTGRLWDYHREKKNDTFKKNTRTNGYIDSLDGTANIKLMMNWFEKKTVQKYQRQEQGLGPIPELEAVYRAMEDCYTRITGSEDVKIQYSMDTKELNVYYTDENGLRTSIPLNQLSDGYKSTISLIADIAYRMAVLNPQLLGDVTKEAGGIILIDEVDLHLHPAWQQRILQDLQEIFPKVQFIVSTHAPAVISSAKSENLLILKDYQIFGVNAQIYGNDTNSILNEIMEVPERHPDIAGLFEQFNRYLVEKRYDCAEQVLDVIDEKRGYHDKEVAGCRVKLKLERIRGGKA